MNDPIPFLNINTSRLLLRKLAASDSEQLFFIRSNELVNQFILRPKPNNIEIIDTFIKDRINDIDNGNIFYWAITTKESDLLIGTICLWNFSEDKSIAEIGYDLHPHYFKKGIMSEALESIIDFGFSSLNLKAIEAYTHKENTASINLLKRHHFILETNRKDNSFSENIIFKLSRN